MPKILAKFGCVKITVMYNLQWRNTSVTYNVSNPKEGTGTCTGGQQLKKIEIDGDNEWVFEKLLGQRLLLCPGAMCMHADQFKTK